MKWIKNWNFNTTQKKKIIILNEKKNLIKKDSNPCSSNPCLNAATCQVTGTSYTCNCAPGYSGTNCAICNIKWIYLKLNYEKNKNIFKKR